MAVERITRLSLTTPDAAGLARFYERAFGFECVSVETRGDRFGKLMGLEAASTKQMLLRIGAQTLELLQFDRPGASYPLSRFSNDRFFQHLAIVVSDMELACADLASCTGWTPITTPNPQHLPPSSGGVSAYKFRDPEGHPLELLQFPPDNIPPAWSGRSGRSPCLGIDHSAIVVADTARSIDFYERGLGFRVSSHSLNQGTEQERLDDLRDVVVEVTGLSLPGAEADSPHLELLCYTRPERREADPSPLNSNDVAAARFVIEVDDIAAVIGRIQPAQIRCIGRGIGQSDGQAVLVLDPDGHALLLQSSKAAVGMH